MATDTHLTATIKVINHQTGKLLGTVQWNAERLLAYLGHKTGIVAAGRYLYDSERRQFGLNADHVVRFEKQCS